MTTFFLAEVSIWAEYGPLIALFGVIIGAIIGQLGSSVTLYLNYRNQQKLRIQQNRERAYSEILGKSALLQQNFVAFLQSQTDMIYHEFSWKNEGMPKESIHREMCLQMKEFGDNLLLEIGKNKQSLFESIGVALAGFDYDNEFLVNCEKIMNQGYIQINDPKDNSDLELWRDKSIDLVQKWVQINYHVPLKNITDKLRDELNSPINLPFYFLNRKVRLNVGADERKDIIKE